MIPPPLNERRREVLRSLIQIYIDTGEPVSSESLCRRLNRALSSATLRNIMAELERSGHLDQPHTSAGRLPTDEGLRVYVDGLSLEPLPVREAAAIESELRAKDASSLQVAQNASQLLSRLTGYIGFVVSPEIAQGAFRHIDLVRLPPPRILVVMLSRSGVVTSKVIEVEETLESEDLQACANYLNTHFAGLSLPAVRTRLLALMKEEKALYDSLLKNILSVGARAFDLDDQAGDVYLGASSTLLEQPEFEDALRMRALFRAFEEKSRLVKILNACLDGEGVRIVIGHEIPDPEMQELALVAASYPVDGGGGWRVGVMGAPRMEYARAIAVVDHMARAVSHAVAEL
jgi:heat-inducible transcriptional repressor